MVKILAPIVVLLLIFAVVDVAVLERSRVRFLPKIGWIVLVVVLPIVGVLNGWFAGERWPVRSSMTCCFSSIRFACECRAANRRTCISSYATRLISWIANAR